MLTITTLGGLSIRRDGEPVTGLASRKAEALLVYLACSERPRPREVLAELLWEERAQDRAMSNLRVVLSSLRKHLAPYVTITRETASLNPESDLWLDAAELEQKLSTGQLEEAVALYHGDFLEGFFVRGSPGFEDWAAIERERLRRLVLDGLCDLVAQHLETGEYKAGVRHATRLLELDPLMEEAHRQLMRLLAHSGQRGAALEQYQTCCQLLSEELGVEPTDETVALCERIRAGELDVPAPAPAREPVVPAHIPAFLEEGEEEGAIERPVFVARERELARLDGFLEAALESRGQVVFVTGGAGRGKTALVQEFARRALDRHPRMLVSAGNCNPYSGVGDPYLPFREVLGMLTGDVEPRWAAGTITRAHARRLWAAVPEILQALFAQGGSLIDIFIPGAALLSRAAAAAPGDARSLQQLQALIQRNKDRPADLAQQQLFDQYTDVLRTLSAHHPLTLLLDDLQWADTASTGLLFHLGRRLEGSRILIVGAYRPDEVALGRPSASSGQVERHPLDKVLAEFKRAFGDVWVDLAQVDEAEGRRFIDAFLETEPNRLGEEFRSGLFRHTGGHALFTVELLRDMQERGDLVYNEERYWIPGPALDWAVLPARVEAVIEERIARLEDELREVLSVASVEGEDFTAQVVARVQEVNERQLLRLLSQELGRRHRLVWEQEEVRVGHQTLSRYRFAHALFQQYLYNGLSAGERRLLHREIARGLEGLYEGRTDEIVVQLAHHWEWAEEPEKAIEYLTRAGDQAILGYANEEAIALFTRALELLKTLPDTPERTRQELVLQSSLAPPLISLKGYGNPEVGNVVVRALELGKQVGDAPQLLMPLLGLASFYGTRTEYRAAHEIWEELLALVERAEDPLLVALSHWLGWIPLFLGEAARALAHLEQVIDFYDPQQHRFLMFWFGVDPGAICLAWMCWALWLLGYPDRALKRSQEALALAQELDHPFTLVFSQAIAGIGLHRFRREPQALQKWAEATSSVSAEHGFAYFQARATVGYGWVLAEQGHVEEGIAQMRQGLDAMLATGSAMYMPMELGNIAEAYGKLGQTEKGLTLLAEALTAAHSSGERYYEAELYRLKGELLLMQGDEDKAEASFCEAIEVARQQSAKSWELRATVSLCRLWQRQGRREEARQVLEEIYGWFTEGFDTADLQEAKTLLEALSY